MRARSSAPPVQGVQEVANVSSIKRTSSKPDYTRHPPRRPRRPRLPSKPLRSYTNRFDRLQTIHNRLGFYFLPGVDLVGGLLRVEALVSLAALGFAGVDFCAGFFAGVVAFLGVDFLPAFFSATAP